MTTSTKKLPSRILLHAVQKWGKTSFAAQAPDPIFLCTRGEDGLMTLIDSDQVKPTAHYPDCFENWRDFRSALVELATAQHPYRTLVVDTLNGAEQLAKEHLVETQFGGSLERFLEWGKGGERLLVAIHELTTLLDRVRSRGMAIVLLCHSKIVNEKNPLGADYGRWAPVLHRDTQAHLERWADAILFGQFAVNVATEGRKGPGKVKGDQVRLIQCEDHAGYVAGNRLGLPSQIDCGDEAATAWNNFIRAIKGK